MNANRDKRNWKSLPKKQLGKSSPPLSKEGRREKKSVSHSEVPRVKSSVTPLPKGLIVEGLPAIREYIKYSPEALKEIWVEEGFENLCAQLEQELESHLRSVRFLRLARESLLAEWGVNQITSHIAALTKKVLLSEAQGLEQLGRLKANNQVVLILDHIQDPRNFGAIIRTAAFFNVRYLFIPDRRQSPLTAVVASTAQGGLALTDIIEVVNLSRLVRALKEEGFWILGADMSGQAIDVKTRHLGKVALVLGSEGDGLSHQIKKQCDLLVGIPSHSGLDSLNVSVAAGVLLSQLVTPI